MAGCGGLTLCCQVGTEGPPRAPPAGLRIVARPGPGGHTRPLRYTALARHSNKISQPKCLLEWMRGLVQESLLLSSDSWEHPPSVETSQSQEAAGRGRPDLEIDSNTQDQCGQRG